MSSFKGSFKGILGSFQGSFKDIHPLSLPDEDPGLPKPNEAAAENPKVRGCLWGRGRGLGLRDLGFRDVFGNLGFRKFGGGGGLWFGGLEFRDVFGL